MVRGTPEAHQPVDDEPHHSGARGGGPVRLRADKHGLLPLQHGVPRGQQPQGEAREGVHTGHEEQLLAVARRAGNQLQVRAAGAPCARRQCRCSWYVISFMALMQPRTVAFFPFRGACFDYPANVGTQDGTAISAI